MRPIVLLSYSSQRVASVCVALVLGASALVAGCGGDDLQVPTAFTATSAATSTAAVASLIGATPVVKITDAKGRAMKDVLVRWRVTAGGGKVVNDSSRTAPSGEASSGGWTLGTASGAQQLQATADGLSPVTFSADATPGPASRLQIVNGMGQRASVNATLPVALAVRAEDFFGNVVPNVPVTFTVLQGGGALTGASARTGPQGVATVGSWTLGTVSGDQLVRATSGAIQDVSFSAIADPGPFSKLTVVSVATQEGAARAPAPTSPTVKTTDAFNNAVGGIPVTFSTGAGSGTVSSPTVTSDATGFASVTWTLAGSNQQSLVASSALLPGVSATFSATVFNSEFDIDVRFVGEGGTTRQRDAFARAVVRWRRALSADVHNTRLLAPAGDCASWVPALNETANDLVIYARLAPIDGPGRVLGRAGPCYLNQSTKLTALGVMEFDLDDLPTLITNGTLDPVVLHEVGHVLGIGTLWDYQRELLVGRASADPYYVGAAASTAFITNGGNSYSGKPIPVENTGGSGTRDSHWRQSIFGRELMQGFSSPGLSPLSATTVLSLADLGYPGVLANSADSFTFGLSAFFESPAAMVPFVDDVADTPLVEIDARGRRTVVHPKRGR